MAAPSYNAADFLGALQALMPRGRAWPRDASAVQTQTLAGLTPTYAVQTGRANYLLADAFPSTANELLPEWEASLGLPSPAAGPSPTLQARRTLVHARFVGAGGLAMTNFIRYAELLGYTITVHGQGSFRCGQSHCGDTVGGAEQMFGWTISTPAATVTPFGAYGLAVLQSELRRIAPPHSVLLFKFT